MPTPKRSRIVAPAIVLALAGSPMLLAQAPADKPAEGSSEQAPAATPPRPPKRPVKPLPHFNIAMFKGAKLPMIQRSVLNNTSGRIDRLAVDVSTNYLYTAARSIGSVQVLDVSTSRQLAPIADLPEPSGVLVLPDHRRVIVSCAGDNSVRTFIINDDGSHSPERTISFEGEADAIRFDEAAQRVYVAHGRNLGSFDLATGARSKSVELPGMPEGVVLAEGRAFVNIPSSGQIAVLDRSADGTLSAAATWTLKDIKGNYGLALDPASGHLFAACRNPAKLAVIDSSTGEQVAALDLAEEADDLWWDPVLKRIYVSCGGGGGSVDVFQQKPGEDGKSPAYEFYHRERTNVGARTSVFIPEQRRLIVAAPQIGADPTFIYVFIVGS